MTVKAPWLVVCALLVSHLGHGALAAQADPGLVEQGRYLAKAGDCAACHGASFKGGDPVSSPIGDIFASNITPDQQTGIGSWTLAQFSNVLRKGQTPDGYLFPAMPYTSYTGLSASQIQALYSYFMLGVAPVSNQPPPTQLPFPFYRPMMAGWNLLFLDEGRPTGAVEVSGSPQERGRVLVETLGHCTACHTPRGELMQQDPKRHLAGAMVGGWWAPNITPDRTGIGGWDDTQLATFLAIGHTPTAVAAGEMGKVVSNSLSQLTKDDIDAIVSYLRALPSIASTEPIKTASAAMPPSEVAIETPGSTDWQTLLDHGSTQAATLYQNACASCHGVDGQGSNGLEHPSLLRIASIKGPMGATLVQVIANGVDRQVGDQHALMPGFRASLDNAQIASLANYVRSTFGGVESNVGASQVAAILDGRVDTPWLIRQAKWLAILAIVAATLFLLGLAWAGVRWVGNHKHSAGGVR